MDMDMTETPTTTTAEELQVMLSEMHNASMAFYYTATHIGVHAFIEFAGLMNEFIKICNDNYKAHGTNFAHASKHTGKALEMQAYQAAYLGEKFGCIFGNAITPHWAAFVTATFDGPAPVVPWTPVAPWAPTPADVVSFSPPCPAYDTAQTTVTEQQQAAPQFLPKSVAAIRAKLSVAFDAFEMEQNFDLLDDALGAAYPDGEAPESGYQPGATRLQLDCLITQLTDFADAANSAASNLVNLREKHLNTPCAS